MLNHAVYTVEFCDSLKPFADCPTYKSHDYPRTNVGTVTNTEYISHKFAFISSDGTYHDYETYHNGKMMRFSHNNGVCVYHGGALPADVFSDFLVLFPNARNFGE